MFALEVCVDSIESAVNAAIGGADRVELCSALSEGGLTPSLGLFLAVQHALRDCTTKIFCMIRVRRGNFIYTDEEIDAMVHDVKYFKSQNADGIVIGCLDDAGGVDLVNCHKLLSAWGNRDTVTFHRAFDEGDQETDQQNFNKNLHIIQNLGIKRILTSGFKKSAELGIDNLTSLVTAADKLGISIMPGAGVTSANAEKIISSTKCKELHASARSAKNVSTATQISMGGGSGDLDPLMVCDVEKVRFLKMIIQRTFVE